MADGWVTKELMDQCRTEWAFPLVVGNSGDQCCSWLISLPKGMWSPTWTLSCIPQPQKGDRASLRLGCSIRGDLITCSEMPWEGLLAAALALGQAVPQVRLGRL